MVQEEVKPSLCSDAEIARLCVVRTHSRQPYFRWKRSLDFLLALLLLVPGMLLVLVVVALVRLTSPGPGIYRQKRVGRGGKVFTMLKIRTMRQDAEVGTGAVWTAVGDPRITRLGRFLRRIHLDELPQLLNVLKGEMSMVGPRPERPEFVAVLVQQIPDYADRLAVLPGVTGLAQINLPPDTDLDSVRRKQYLDLQYIQTATLWLDLRMILCTSLRSIGISGQTATWLLRLQRTVHLDAQPQPMLPVPELASIACSETLADAHLRTLQDTQTFRRVPAGEGEEPKETRWTSSRVVLSETPINGNGNGSGNGNGNGNGAGNGKKRAGEPAVRTAQVRVKPR